MRTIDADKTIYYIDRIMSSRLGKKRALSCLHKWVDKEAGYGFERHGKWEFRHVDDAPAFLRDRWYCSECKQFNTYGLSKFCPNCGAKMNGGEQDDK